MRKNKGGLDPYEMSLDVRQKDNALKLLPEADSKVDISKSQNLDALNSAADALQLGAGDGSGRDGGNAQPLEKNTNTTTPQKNPPRQIDTTNPA